MEPARVSSSQVDLTRYGLDKTPTLLVLQCPGATRSPEEGEVYSLDARPRWQNEWGQTASAPALISCMASATPYRIAVPGSATSVVALACGCSPDQPRRFAVFAAGQAILQPDWAQQLCLLCDY